MNRLERLDKILNGGKGSGNFNPGQGRGVGKPGNKTPKSNPSKASNIDEHKKYEKAVHKLPKERRTKHQLEIIHSLDNMGVLNEEMSKWLRLYGDEETLGAIEKGLSDAEEIGLDLSNIHLDRLRTGSKIWGRAWASGKIAFVGQFYDGNPKKLWSITYPSGGFHTNDSIMGLVRHEIGHQISYQNARDRRLQKDKPKNIWQGDEISNYCGEVISKAMGYQFFSYSETLKDLQKMSNSDISKYGRTNFNEAIAESWSNPDYSEFTKKVSNILREDSMSKTKTNSLNKIEKDIPLCTGYGPEFEDDDEEEVLSRNQRLDFILNGGKGSGNFNPGQGRGVGKPSNHSINTDISKSGLTHKSGEATAGYTGTTSASIINDLLRQGLDTKDYQSVIDRLDSNMEEIKVDTLLKRGVSFNFLKANSEAFGITEDMSYKEVQKNIIGKSFKELGYSSATYGDESDYGSIHLKITCPKGTKALWTGNDKEKEVIISRGTTFKVNDYRRENEDDPWSKIIVDLEVISQDDLNKKNNMITNGGPGSGNFNPGQGRGVGKPSNKSKKLTYEEYAKKFKESTRSEKRELDKEYPEYADRYFKELMGRHIQREKDEKSFEIYEKDNSHPHFDLDKVPTELKYALDITPTQGLKKYDPKTQTLIDLKNRKEYYNEEKGIWVRVISMSPRDYSRTIIENNNGHYTSMKEIEDRTSKGGIDMYVEKFKNRERQEVPYIKFNKEGKFSGEQEGFHRSFAADEIGDKEIPVLIVTDYYGKQPFLNHGRDITKDVENYYASKSKKNSLTRNQRLDLIMNGGPGSGNFNPGQGRGIGKPANGNVKSLEYDFSVEPHRRDGMMTNGVMDYLLKNKELGIKVDEDKIRELYEKKCWHKDKFKNFEEYRDKLIHLQIQKEGGNISEAADFQRFELQDMVKNKILYSDSGTFEALTRYVDGATPSGYGRRGKHPRKNFDEKYGISKFIDKNPFLNYGDKPIYRGLTVTKEFLDSLKVGDKVDMRGASSWTANEKEAQLFLNGSLVQKGSEKVIFENAQKNKRNTMIYPISNQAEVISSDTNKCKVVNIEERELPIKGGSNEKAIYITVEFD